ncbi:chemotaxis protein CheX [Chitinispirillales bacterium ANBcel5]|uniref:chemotaxis protein CheX n=1 Tax=Cellulosispirillum alkaliphilum TaxID=3039283 RepID=UPI002A53C264|nr:chemotaxis protein CheX [Chitinispirillales bacterium ANBcel5]
MNVSYINPFIMSTIETFKKMLNSDIEPGKVALKNSTVYSYDISGIIGLSGEAQGSICLSFPKIVALKVITALLGVEVKIIGEEVTDGIGELANIVAGNAKKHLTQYDLSISLPKVVIGKDHKVASQRGVPTLMVPFKSSLGEFAMEISLKTP